MDLDQSDFDSWMKDPITLKLFELFEDNISDIKELIFDLDVVNDDHVDRRLAYYAGNIHMCTIFSNLSFDQMFITEEVKSEDEETPYSW